MSPVSRTAKAAAVGALAATVAGFGATQAFADTTTPTPSGTSTAAPGTPGQDGAGAGRGGPGHRGGPGLDVAALAKALGLTEAKVQSALDSVRESLKPSSPPAGGTAPTEADRAAREEAMVAALAKALGVTEAKVQSALDTVHEQREAQHRTELSGRLDDAVDAGTLTTEDKASVLKAFDAGVLGGPRR